MNALILIAVGFGYATTPICYTRAMLFARHCAEKTANGTWP